MNLESPAEELRQVVASVLRNLSWNADYVSKQVLRDVGAVTLLTKVYKFIIIIDLLNC
jgi:adenomatosis polyposis coli protein